MMINGKSDDLDTDGAQALPSIANSLRVANAIAILKELHDMKKIGDDDYVESMRKLLKSCGYDFDLI